MKDQKRVLAELISGAAEGITADEAESMIEIPPESEMGDFAFPCFRLAKAMRKAPKLIAEDIADALRGNSAFDEVRNVNGYVNFFLNRAEFEADVFEEILKKGDSFGRSDEGEGKTVIVEFSSPNIAKPFHIGHIRSTVIGNAVYKLYDAIGYKVVRINHLGDYGTQFGKMIVAYKKWGSKEDVEKEPIKTLLSYYVRFHEEAEKDPALEDEARATFTRLENGEKEETELWQWFRDESLKEFTYVYELLGIEFDSYAGESFYSDKMDRIVDIMNEKGILKESQGAQIVDLEPYGLTPALIKKSDGSTLYITRDIAAAIYRKETYDFYRNIYVVASQQNLHFQQWFKIIELMGYDWADECVHVPFGMVSLEDGTMSTRKGKVVFLLDVLNGAVEKTREVVAEKRSRREAEPSGDGENNGEERARRNDALSEEELEKIYRDVGIGAVIFQELSNNRIKDYTFSMDRMLNFDGETGPYVQYTHARANSIIKNAGADAQEILNGSARPDMSLAAGDNAYELMKAVYRLPQIISDAAAKYEPSVLTRHVVDIAQLFNRFYNGERVIVEDKAEKQAKLAVVISAKQAIRNGLSLLGIAAPERM